MSPFEFHTGYTYEEHGDQYIGTCPFCEKENKFYYNKEWLWDCKNGNCVDPVDRKRRSGNAVSFLRQLYIEHETLTKAAHKVHDWRKLPLGRVQQAGVKYNPWNDSIIIPTFRNGKVSNLYKVVAKNVQIDGEWKEKLMILCTPGVEHTLMDYPDHTEDTVWVCEGHWDKIAAMSIVGETNSITPIGVPGSGVWKKHWTDVLAEKDVVFCYDNDNSGRSGFEKIILKHIAGHHQKPRSISFIDWPEGTPEKYDLNDCYREHGKRSLAFLKEHIREFESPEGSVIVKSTIENVPANKDCDTYDKLMDIFAETYHTTQDMKDCLLLVLSSIYSIAIEGEQLWLRIIGPPGCGKTTIAKAVSAADQVVLKSTFTGLFSGWRDDSGEDKSMVPLISGKTLIVKDADALLRQPNVDRIFSELRDFYDKDSSTGYRHGFNHDYRNVRSTMILCGTNVLRRSDSSFLGERFLDYELTITSADEDLISNKMMEKSMQVAMDPSALPPDTAVMAASKGFIEHLMERPMNTRLTPEIQTDIRRLAKLTAQMRTKVDRDMQGKGEVTFAPVIELPTRLIGQLVKMCMCVPIISGRIEDSRRLLRKVVKDIIDPTSNRYQMCMILIEGYYSRDEIVESTGITKSTVTRELDNLRILKLVDEKSVASKLGIPGRKSKVFKLKEEVIEGLISLGL